MLVMPFRVQHGRRSRSMDQTTFPAAGLLRSLLPRLVLLFAACRAAQALTAAAVGNVSTSASTTSMAGCAFADLDLGADTEAALAARTAARRPCQLDRHAVALDGVSCTVPELCATGAFMAHSLRCADGVWEWGLPASFCAAWEHCSVRFAADDEGLARKELVLECDGRRRTPSAASVHRLPPNQDPRLRRYVVVHHEELSDVLEARNAVFLNVSSNNITELRFAAFGALRALDASFNRITHLNYGSLPNSGSMRFLSIIGSVGRAVVLGPNALVPAFASCQYTTLPDVTLSLPVGHGCGFASSFVQDYFCYHLVCPWAGADVEPRVRCAANSSDTYAITRRCDLVNDCPNKEDEHYCGLFGLQQVVWNASASVSPQCATVLPCLDAIKVLSKKGVLLLTPQTADESICPAHMRAIPLRFVDDGEEGGYLAMDGYGPTDGHLIVTIYESKFSMAISFIPFVGGLEEACHVRYTIVIDPDNLIVPTAAPMSTTLLPATTSTTTTTLTTTSTTSTVTSTTATTGAPVAAGSAKTSVSTAVVGGVLGAIALGCLMLLFVFYIQRKRINRRIRSAATPSTPAAVLLQANESFAVQYAPLFGGRQACTAAYEQLQIAPEDVRLTGDILGAGHTGTVALAHLAARRTHPAWTRVGAHPAEDGLVVAVKTVLAASAPTMVNLLLEARLLAAMAHPHLVRLLAVQEKTQPLLLVLEHCALGDLQTFLRRNRLAHLTCSVEVARADLARQVALGVEYLHSNLCLHRDLAARNVLLVGAGDALPGTSRCGVVAKLADLGLARMLGDGEDAYYKSTSEDAVPVRWQCPHALKSRAYNARSDVYSFGVVLWEIYNAAATPYGDLSAVEVMEQVTKGHRLRFAADALPLIVALTRECTQVEVSSRPLMTAVRERLEAICQNLTALREAAASSDTGSRVAHTTASVDTPPSYVNNRAFTLNMNGGSSSRYTAIELDSESESAL